MILTWFRVVIYPTQMIASRRGFWPMRTDVGQWPLTLDLELSSFVSFKSNVLFIHGLREWLRRADERCDSPPLSLEWRQSSAGRTQPNKYGDCRHLHLKKKEEKKGFWVLYSNKKSIKDQVCAPLKKKKLFYCESAKSKVEYKNFWKFWNTCSEPMKLNQKLEGTSTQMLINVAIRI